jgi:hypothetical protein
MIRATFLIAILTGICQFSIAQDNAPRFGITISPNLSTELIYNDGSVPTEIANTVEDREIWKPSFSVGMIAQYKLSDRAYLNFGVGYMNAGVQTEEYSLVPNDPALSQFTGPNPATAVQYIYNSHYVEVPVSVKRYIGERLYGNLGLSSTFTIANTTTSMIQYADGSTNTTKRTDNNDSVRLAKLAKHSPQQQTETTL